jgi:hypothetical protein
LVWWREAGISRKRTDGRFDMEERYCAKEGVKVEGEVERKPD